MKLGGAAAAAANIYGSLLVVSWATTHGTLLSASTRTLGLKDEDWLSLASGDFTQPILLHLAECSRADSGLF